MRQRQRRPMRNSPRRQKINQQLDEHSNRIKEFLKADITVLEEQNALLKTKCKKLGELQDKVQLVLRQNNQLLGENQKMSRLLHQHKSENDILKSKLDQQSNQKIGILSQFQFKQKQLISEIQNLSLQIQELDDIKNMQINEVKTQCQLDLQNLKRQHGSSLDLYDQEIRKLKEMLDRREFELGQLSSRFKKQASQFEYDLLKSVQDKQKLKNQIGYMQADHKKDLEDLRQRLDSNYLDEIELLKRSHFNNLEIIEKQNLKLKGLIDRLTNDNDSLKGQFDKSTAYYQDTIGLLKRQNDSLKLQLIELQKISENEKADIQDDLGHLRKRQIAELKQFHEDHLNRMETELISLENVNRSQANQIEQLVREKATARNLFDNENARLKQDIQTCRDKNNEIETIFTSKVRSLQNKIEEKQKQNSYLQQLYRDMKTNSDSQIASLKQLLSQKKIQLEKHKIASREAQQAALEQKNTLKNQKQTLKEALKRQQKQKQIQKQNYQSLLNETQAGLRAKLESFISKTNIIDKENEGLKKNIQLKQKQIKGIKERLSEGQIRQTKLQNEIHDYRQKLLQKDKKNNQALEQQKQRLQKSHSYLAENIKSDNEAALRLEAAKQKQLRQKLSKKQKQLENLLKMHKKMCDEVKALTEQESNKKKIDLKFPGATADLIATKNMFDVFLKTKLLDVCSDVIYSQQKQNIPQ